METKEEYKVRHYQKVPKPAPRSAHIKRQHEIETAKEQGEDKITDINFSDSDTRKHDLKDESDVTPEKQKYQRKTRVSVGAFIGYSHSAALSSQILRNRKIRNELFLAHLNSGTTQSCTDIPNFGNNIRIIDENKINFKDQNIPRAKKGNLNLNQQLLTALVQSTSTTTAALFNKKRLYHSRSQFRDPTNVNTRFASFVSTSLTERSAKYKDTFISSWSDNIVTVMQMEQTETSPRVLLDPGLSLQGTVNNLGDAPQTQSVLSESMPGESEKSTKDPSENVPAPAKKKRKKNKEDEDVVVPTKGEDWSLNKEVGEDGLIKRFWWNKTYSHSIWEQNINLIVDGRSAPLDPKTNTVPDELVANATDTDVWRAFIEYQTKAVYKVCPICKQPEQNVDCKVCCYCGNTVHCDAKEEGGWGGCCVKAEPDNIIWKGANKGFEEFMCICYECEDVKEFKPRPFDDKQVDNARRACIRALASRKELPLHISKGLNDLLTEMLPVYGKYGERSSAVSPDVDALYLDKVRDLVAAYFQPGDSSSYLTKQPIETKCGGLGVVAVKDIPRFTVIGVYPGYEDPLSGEQAKYGRPGPKYSLVDLNCADFYNNVFTEMAKTFTPFINEPNIGETSNVAWIQENIKPEGRLSVMSVRDIKAGEELLIGYGPLYPRTYPYTYDAYAYHEVDNMKNCFALWHWKSLEEKDAAFVCYCGYEPSTGKYSYWETEDEMKERKAAEAAKQQGKPPKKQPNK